MVTLEEIKKLQTFLYKDKYESAKVELFDKTPIIKKPKGTRVR